MRLTALYTDDDAVSPVIGVILMVAITVILAAVIGTFVLGLGEQAQDAAPQVSFTFDYDEGVDTPLCDMSDGSPSGNLTTTHDGGDKVDNSTIDLVDVEGNSHGWANCDESSKESVTAGDNAVAGIDSDDTVRVIWTSASGGDSATLGKFTGPGA